MSDLKEPLNNYNASEIEQQYTKHGNCCRCCHQRNAHKWLFFTGLSLILTILGGWIFYKCEYHHESDQIQQKIQYNELLIRFLKENNANSTILNSYNVLTNDLCDTPSESTDNRWKFSSAMFFAFTTASTIGYGFTAPQTHWGRAFTFIYGLPSIALFGLSMVNIGKLIIDGIDRRQQKRNNKALLKGRRTLALILILTILVFCGAFMLKHNEYGSWTFGECLYFMWVSITTIGYGDLQPTLKEGKWFIICIFIYCGLTIIAILITSIQDWTSNKMQRVYVYQVDEEIVDVHQDNAPINLNNDIDA